MRTGTRLLIAALAVLTGGTSFVVANELGMPASDSPIAAGDAPVAACDTDGLTTSPQTNAAGEIASLVIGGIDAACLGQQLQVVLLDGAGAVIESFITTVASSSASLNLTAPLPPLSALAAAKIAIAETAS